MQFKSDYLRLSLKLFKMVLYNSQSIKETYVNVHPHPLLLHQREDIDRSALSTGADLQGVLHMFASCVKEHHERTSVLRCVCLFLCCAFSFVSHQLKPISTLYHISFIPLPLVAYDSISHPVYYSLIWPVG